MALYEALLVEYGPIQFTLTDKYPNLSAFQSLSSQCPSGVRYVREPVDATRVPSSLAGMRTMFNAFHHFSPEFARRVLEDAVQARQSIGIFEVPERNMLMLVSLLFTPIFVVFATPFIKPFRWKRLLWTYMVPLVPLTCWWDGLISVFRAYTVTEMLALTEGLVEYDWKAGRVGIDGTVGHVTHLLGTARSSHV